MHWKKVANKIFLFLFGIFFFGCAGGVSAVPAEHCNEKLYGAKWQIVMIDNDRISIEPAPFIRFSKDGRSGGFGGCNSFFTEAVITRTAMTFSKIGSTRRFCPGVNGEVERRIFSILNGVKWWQFDENENLVIFDSEHRLILEKSAE